MMQNKLFKHGQSIDIIRFDLELVDVKLAKIFFLREILFNCYMQHCSILLSSEFLEQMGHFTNVSW